MLGKLDNPGAATEVTISGCTGTRNGCFIDDPAISPDGRRIAFTMVGLNSQGTKDGSYNIHIVDVISSRMWQVTFTTADSWSPSYSSEGRWLAFDQGGFIYKADLCGGGWQVGRRLRERAVSSVKRSPQRRRPSRTLRRDSPRRSHCAPARTDEAR
jgi:Tol biopolymer transport system component